MARKHGTTKSGGSFTDETIRLVWRKGKVVAGVDPNKRRQDMCGAWID